MMEEEEGRDGDSVGDERNQGRVDERGKYKRWLRVVRKGKDGKGGTKERKEREKEKEKEKEREEGKRGRKGGKK